MGKNVALRDTQYQVCKLYVIYLAEGERNSKFGDESPKLLCRAVQKQRVGVRAR